MECPICLESASDDPVLTPCAHRMCGECFVFSSRTPDGGPCPLCRSHISKSGLIILPAQSRFQVDAKKNWKDSCKVKKKTYNDAGEPSEEKGEEHCIQPVYFLLRSSGDPLHSELQKGIKFLWFDGKLSQKHKEKVLKEFSESQDKLVLMMSLKAGGVGLNLIAVSNVFYDGSMVESSCGRAGFHENSPCWAEKRGPSQTLHRQGYCRGASGCNRSKCASRGWFLEHLKMLFK